MFNLALKYFQNALYNSLFFKLDQFLINVGFSDGTVVKNPSANAGDARDVNSIPGSGGSPGVGNGDSLQYSCPGNSTDRGAWGDNSPWGHKESDTTE